MNNICKTVFVLAVAVVCTVNLVSFDDIKEKISGTAASAQQKDTGERSMIASQVERSILTELLNKWYPQSIDKQYGGFISTFTYDWKPSGSQDKMIVTQARHTWSNAKASQLYPKVTYYKNGAEHGFLFLRDVMWDKLHGGFYTLVDRMGNIINSGVAAKDAYGNAFAIFALAACYQASGDTAVLGLARKAFMWLEEHSHDKIGKGYFQHLTREGTPIKRQQNTPSTSDLGYKDQNSSIHLLEAFTELYSVWPDSLVRERLHEMLLLIRDVITTKEGYLGLFFQPDWTPVSFRESPDSIILQHRNLDHVSFGHDVETAFLMLEASHTLGLKNDTSTMRISKTMIDHALRNGWDSIGGFYDEGYYFKDKPGISIIKDSKNWWAQAEGLNTLLLMADHFPGDELHYFEKFRTQWNYIQRYMIDHEYGDWYAGGLDKEPEQKKALKGHIWKGNYHQFRALMNCLHRLRPDTVAPSVPKKVMLNLSQNNAMLTWGASSDNKNLLGYNIYQNENKTGFTPLRKFLVTGARKGDRFIVRSVDLQGNESLAGEPENGSQRRRGAKKD